MNEKIKIHNRNFQKRLDSIKEWAKKDEIVGNADKIKKLIEELPFDDELWGKLNESSDRRIVIEKYLTPYIKQRGLDWKPVERGGALDVEEAYREQQKAHERGSELIAALKKSYINDYKSDPILKNSFHIIKDNLEPEEFAKKAKQLLYKKEIGRKEYKDSRINKQRRKRKWGKNEIWKKEWLQRLLRLVL